MEVRNIGRLRELERVLGNELVRNVNKIKRRAQILENIGAGIGTTGFGLGILSPIIGGIISAAARYDLDNYIKVVQYSWLSMGIGILSGAILNWIGDGYIKNYISRYPEKEETIKEYLKESGFKLIEYKWDL